ncbi:DNA-binding response regulator, OmpR family, contains REC and winged-helix (wHTH) domain [Marinomonas polaris DSM 16579]|uniref:DNA-binding response regulator, OmpR family, contains REC and winged-helix (WHTH) domain n=2 Tax=Marinomonas TaxID=28253 RepID=A0A1M4X0A2_9GAMM|nr:DNA-binding response regulator, OmpR family, contains REC and winged-helix (wHTH) domain [Marinomonas polaris DSM 16579]
MLMSDIKILVVDDSSVIRETLESYFAEEGYTVSGADTAEAAEQLLGEQEFDLILLDIRLPGKDGLTLTRELRSRSEVGIILVTGKQDDIDRIIGLECGADEYVCKPFNAREVLARGKNLIRRVRNQRELAKKPIEEPVFRSIGTWQLDTSRRVLLKSDRSVSQLTEGEFQLLLALKANEGVALTRDQLMDRIKNRTWNATDRTIDVLIGRIRRKLSEDPHCPQMIITVHGVGYLLSNNPQDDL